MFFDYDAKPKKMIASGNCNFCKIFSKNLKNIVYYVPVTIRNYSYNKKYVNWVCSESCQNILILQMTNK